MRCKASIYIHALYPSFEKMNFLSVVVVVFFSVYHVKWNVLFFFRPVFKSKHRGYMTFRAQTLVYKKGNGNEPGKNCKELL